MNDELTDFTEFMRRRELAAKAYVSGNSGPLDKISTHSLPATFFSPKGDFQEGADNVSSTYKSDAGAFDSGNDSEFEILQMAASDGIAFWVGFQRASVKLKGKADPVQFNLRITEIFRREGDDWKMVHRHADALKSEAEAKKA